MEVFVASVNDQHINPIMRVFGTADRAIAWASREFRGLMVHPEEIVMHPADPSEFPLVWRAECGPGRDYAEVWRATVDEE